ncbi:MAG: GNAT family N-acetyltransferase [Zavarzinella sp.]
MIQYRNFRNSDPPGLTSLWNRCFQHRGAVELNNNSYFDLIVVNKPYFDPNGFFVAEDNHQIVGFSHAGFGPNAELNTLDPHLGVVCIVAVDPEYQRRKIGSELLQRAEQYLLKAGAKRMIGGSTIEAKPFYNGLYGGSNAPGVLLSDENAHPFLRAHQYEERDRVIVLERGLRQPISLFDRRFVPLMRQMETQTLPNPRLGSWWRECVYSLLNLNEFRLNDKSSLHSAARIIFWEMKEFGWRRGVPTAGLVDVQVRSEHRRKGVGKYLLCQFLKYLQEQHFGAVETHVPANDAGVLQLFESVGFQQVDTGISYEKQLPLDQQ